MTTETEWKDLPTFQDVAEAQAQKWDIKRLNSAKADVWSDWDGCSWTATWSPRRYGDTRRVQIDSTTINANMTAEDLTKLSLDELRTMAARVFAQRAERDDTIDVTPADDNPLGEEAA